MLAKKKKVLARALQVEIPEEIFVDWKNLRMNNYLNTLGLAARARKIVTGETLITKIRSNEVEFVIIASDASDNTKKRSPINVQVIKLSML